MEYFDVLDKNRKKMGYTKQRGATLGIDEFNMGVEIYFLFEDKILITQRCKQKSHPLEWEVPGGCAKSKQTSIDTVICEIKEEIGIDIKKEDIKLLTTEMYKKMFVDIYISTKYINLSKTHLQEDEVSDIRYVTYDEFEQLYKDGKVVHSVYERYKKIKNQLCEERSI